MPESLLFGTHWVRQSLCSFAVWGGIYVQCSLFMVVMCAGAVRVHCCYLVLCGVLCIVAWDMWPYPGNKLLFTVCLAFAVVDVV